jgi:hypothetical protein
MTSDRETTKINFVYLEKLGNFVFGNFYLVMQNYISI